MPDPRFGGAKDVCYLVYTQKAKSSDDQRSSSSIAAISAMRSSFTSEP